MILRFIEQIELEIIDKIDDDGDIVESHRETFESDEEIDVEDIDCGVGENSPDWHVEFADGSTTTIPKTSVEVTQD